MTGIDVLDDPELRSRMKDEFDGRQCLTTTRSSPSTRWAATTRPAQSCRAPAGPRATSASGSPWSGRKTAVEARAGAAQAASRKGSPSSTRRKSSGWTSTRRRPRARRRRRRSSSGCACVKTGEAAAFVSAGNTGAVMAGAIMYLGRIRGIERPSLAGLIPLSGRAHGAAGRRRQRRRQTVVPRAVGGDGRRLHGARLEADEPHRRPAEHRRGAERRATRSPRRRTRRCWRAASTSSATSRAATCPSAKPM